MAACWIILDARYRWVHFAPSVVTSDPEMLSYILKIHITLSDMSPSRALCGRDTPGDYRPIPFQGTYAIGEKDACVNCVRLLRERYPQAIAHAGSAVYSSGDIIGIPRQPHLPPQVLEMIQHLAQSVQDTQSAVKDLVAQLASAGVALPEGLQAPTLAPPGITVLRYYQDFVQWCHDNPRGFVASLRSTGTVSIHYSYCSHAADQMPHTFNGALGTYDYDLILPEVERIGKGHMVKMCEICHPK
jgi:hypothetical protein